MSHETHSFQLTFAGITVNKEHYHLEPFMITNNPFKIPYRFPVYIYTKKDGEEKEGEAG